MKIKYKDAAVVVEKGVVVSIKTGYRAILTHPFLAVFIFFSYLLYCFLPGVFGFLANSSPVILCTTILLGTLLSYGNPNIPEIDEEVEEESSTQDHSVRNRGVFVEKEKEQEGDSFGKTEDNDVAVIQAEGDREKKVDDGSLGCLDSSSLHVLLPKKAVAVSGSDGEESCSPDASMADILPLLDELDPFFNSEICRPVRVSIYDSDDTCGTYSEDDEESEVDSSSEGEEEEEEGASETQHMLKGDGDGGGRAVPDATAWNADDMRNFKDLKSSELERNQRLENLIAKRKARKNVTGSGNFIDLDQSTLDRYSNLQISNLSKGGGGGGGSRSNPFDDPEENNDLQPIPSSAPSVFSKRNNPFEFHQPFMPGRNIPSTDDTYGELQSHALDENSYAQFQTELAGKDRSKLSIISESESEYNIPYSSLPPIETSNIDATLREPLLSSDGENSERNIMIQSMADDENVTTEAHSMAEFDVIPDHYLTCDVPKIAEPSLDESGVELPNDLSTDDVFKISSSDSKYQSLLSELDAVGDFGVHQTDQMYQQHSDSSQTVSDSESSDSGSGSHSDSTEIETPSRKEESKNTDSDSESDSGSKSSSIDGTHQTSEVHSELHDAGDTHFVLIHDRELIDDETEKSTEEKEHTDDMDVDDELPFSLPEDMDVALKRLFRQNTMKKKKKGMLEDDPESEKQQEDLHWELRQLFRHNTLKKKSKLDETEKQQQEEDFLSALKLLFQEKDNRQTGSDDDDDDEDDTTVQDMHMALKRLFRQFSIAPERCNEFKDDKDFEQCEKKIEMNDVEMPTIPSNLVQAKANSSSDVSQFEQISEGSQVASVSDEHKQTDKLIESPDMIQENAYSENESEIIPEEASQIPSIHPQDSN